MGVFAKRRNLGLLKAPVLGTPTGESLTTTEDDRGRKNKAGSLSEHRALGLAPLQKSVLFQGGK